MTDLADLIEPLKREIAVPGEFESVFPNTTDEDLLATLADALGEAQLDSYFQTTVLDDTEAAYPVTPDLSAAGAALLVMYAGSRILRARLRQLNASTRYKAGNVEYETTQSANLLRDELATLTARRIELLTLARSAGRVVYQLDAYLGRAAVNWATLGGFYPNELTRP